VMRLAALTLVLPSSLALLISHLPTVGLEKDLIFVLVFVFQGLHATAYNIGGSNFLLDLAPSSQRALYIGFAHGLVGAAIFASPLGGAIVDLLGFEPLFLFSLAFSLIAVALSLRLDEPRRRQPLVR
jgi:MFS family permease